MSSKTFLLIPGAWSDESIWSSLRTELSKLEITTYTITLSGLEKNDKPNNVDLFKHVDEVVTFVDTLKFNQLVLVGHSYSGFVASLAANKIADKVSGLIFIEAFLPENGKSLLEMAGLDIEEETNSIKNNKGVWLPPTKEELKYQPFLSDEQIKYLTKSLIGHPGRTVTDKAIIKSNNLKNIPTSYIGGNLPDNIKENTNFGDIDFFKINGGHWPMLTKPRELAEIIDKISNYTPTTHPLKKQ